MLGVFMKRWKPKRNTNDRNGSSGEDHSLSPEPPDRPPPKDRQYLSSVEEKNHIFDYEPPFRRRMDDANMNYQTASPIYSAAPNICVEGGKIEFVRTAVDSARITSTMITPPASPAAVPRTTFTHRRNLNQITGATILYDELPEKFDTDKEMLERRIRQLEYQLEEEKRKTQRERLTVAKIQNKLAKREGQARSDAEREKRARCDSEARARSAEAEAARIGAKLHAAQKEIARMEETVHNLLQYKTRAETLKQEKSSLAATLETKSTHYQSQLSHLQAENENLRGQLLALSAGLDGEFCMDDVAHQVITTLLSQKGLREELGCMRSRVRELEAQNAALSALLVRQLRPHPRPSPASPPPPATMDRQVQVINYDTTTSCRSSPGSLPPPDCRLEHRTISSTSLISFKEDSPPPQKQQCISQLSTSDKRRHRILTSLWAELRGLEVTPAALARALSAVDTAHLVPPSRPHSLHLPAPATAPIAEGQNEEEQIAGSPESGNKDEGYSTMSSDVQADSSRQSEHNRELEDLKEASDETDNQTIVSVGLRDARVPVSETLTPDRGSFTRYSFPPAKFSLPIKPTARSLSDSHLCVSFAPCIETRFSIFSSAPSSGGVVVLELAGAANVGSVAGVDGSQYDAEYVRHWLEIDDARSALQQRHRDLLDLDYDRAEVEDWSLSLSCDDLREDWRRKDPATPGQLSLSTLPSIKEDDVIENDDPAVDCVWPEGNWTCDVSPTHSVSVSSPSPPASWSSGAGSDLPDDGRQSAPPGEEMTNSGIGIDFTRDFYRLVKYESTRSLASDASQPPPDREKALKSVLDFIAEQKKYCREREECDSLPSRPVSEINGDINITSTSPNGRLLERDKESPLDFALLENEADERYFKRIQEKNEINKCSYPFIIESNTFLENKIDHEELIVHEPLFTPSKNHFSPESEPCSPSKNSNGFPTSTKRTNELKSPINKCTDSPIPLRRGINSLDRSPISRRNGLALDSSLMDEVFNGCKRNSSLQPLPEEEETSRSCEEKQSPNDSPTKENSIRSETKKNMKKSKIPMATGVKMSQKRVSSKIPVSKGQLSKGSEGESSLQFLENASSKDVIEELNRMICQNEDVNPSVSEENKQCTEDKDLWCPSGWVRIQKNNEYSDPTTRASLLDVMVASSDSSPSPTEVEEDGAQYSKLHHLHRNRRQKKAAALRERGMAVLRETCYRRPSILDREDLFVRYGEREREAVASFDFLENISSSASSPDNDKELSKDQLKNTDLKKHSQRVHPT